ncbi:hypothetical protein Cob_v009235 [Colletotrichum orbiculare MAFF 240422]|uniref:Uncharacterized protein n=1 Tax=Colletotrichum orbiculare (strain 104-T / ATCC 96160 / CBS 514.97 / LARS 414 / MAFF 240422) TaxID=1213857 RepID=A0A484FJ06_COLOR|nr:hypothetical protein Cob_v009235 [Colletotrichum orbiculare MAFF 240422]
MNELPHKPRLLDCLDSPEAVHHTEDDLILPLGPMLVPVRNRLSREASTPDVKYFAYFLHRNRRELSRCLEEFGRDGKAGSEDPLSDSPTLNSNPDKTELLDSWAANEMEAAEHRHPEENFGGVRNFDDDDEDRDDDVQDIKEAEVVEFVQQSLSYNWFAQSLQVEISLMPQDEDDGPQYVRRHVSQCILENLPTETFTRTKSASTHQVAFKVPWEELIRLKTQSVQHHISLGTLILAPIVVTRTANGAQISSIKEYLDQMWPLNILRQPYQTRLD